LWIAFTAVFASLLLYLAFVGHREQVVRVTSAMPDMLKGLTSLVEGISLPAKKQTASAKKIFKTEKTTRNTPVKPDKKAQLPANPVKKTQLTAKPVAPLPKPVAVSDVALTNVEYDKKGRLALTGNASSGARIAFFIDGVKIKHQKLQKRGRWKLIVPEGVSAGQHRLEASVADQSGGPGIIVVMPFVKAGPEEIAALAPPEKKIETVKVPDDLEPEPVKNKPLVVSEKPKIVARNSTQNEPGKAEVPIMKKEPVRKKSPGFSKLAELARSQSVKRDVYPLSGVLPKLMIGDGPSLATPQAHETGNASSRPGSGLSPGRAPAVKPAPAARDKPATAFPEGVKKPLSTLSANTAAKSLAKPEPESVRPVKIRRPGGNFKQKGDSGKGLVVVQPGNTLWDLAISIYGSGLYYQKLYQANRRSIKNPQLIFPGQIIFAPDANPPRRIEPLSPPQWLPPQ